MSVVAHRRSAGFTLVELLVVVAITAVLASMLLPAAGAVRAAARKAGCASNLREIHMSLLTYSSDWRGMIMMVNYTPHQTWGRTLRTYLGLKSQRIGSPREAGSFNCPENTAQYEVMGTGLGDGETSYMGNAWADDRSAWEGRFFGTSLRMIRYPAELLVAWDGVYCRSDPGANTGSGDNTVGHTGVRLVHRKAANLLFADGHVDSTRLLPYRGAAYGPAGFASTYVNGRLFYVR